MTENTRRSGRAIKYIYLATRPHGHRDRILLCLMASSQHGNSAEFRVRAKRILLTYSQVESNFDHQQLIRLIARLGARGCICRELHRNGGVHYHALLVFDSAYHTRDAHRFDVGGTHPNIQPIRWTPRRAYEYVQKDGDIIYNNLEDNDIDGPGTSSSTHWADIIASPDKATFFEKIGTLDPRALVCSFPSIEKYADWAYREEQQEYESPVVYAERDDWIGEELNEWYEATLRGRADPGR